MWYMLNDALKPLSDWITAQEDWKPEAKQAAYDAVLAFLNALDYARPVYTDGDDCPERLVSACSAARCAAKLAELNRMI